MAPGKRVHCLFCYKVSRRGPKLSRDDDDLHPSFMELLDRHLGGVPLYDDKELRGILGGRKIGYCEDCTNILNSFRELYHKLRCLELEVDSKVWKLANVMKCADKVTSRIQAFQEDMKEEGVEGEVVWKLNRFRGSLLRECFKKLKKAPRVTVKRDAAATHFYPKVNEKTEELDTGPGLFLEDLNRLDDTSSQQFSSGFFSDYQNPFSDLSNVGSNLLEDEQDYGRSYFSNTQTYGIPTWRNGETGTISGESNTLVNFTVFDVPECEVNLSESQQEFVFWKNTTTASEEIGLFEDSSGYFSENVLFNTGTAEGNFEDSLSTDNSRDSGVTENSTPESRSPTPSSENEEEEVVYLGEVKKLERNHKNTSAKSRPTRYSFRSVFKCENCSRTFSDVISHQIHATGCRTKIKGNENNSPEKTALSNFKKEVTPTPTNNHGDEFKTKNEKNRVSPSCKRRRLNTDLVQEPSKTDLKVFLPSGKSKSLKESQYFTCLFQRRLTLLHDRIMLHYNFHNTQVTVNPRKCDACYRPFYDEFLLNLHKIRVHSLKFCDQCLTIGDISAVRNYCDSSVQLKCHECCKDYEDERGYVFHTLFQHNDATFLFAQYNKCSTYFMYQCPFCPEKFVVPGFLRVGSVNQQTTCVMDLKRNPYLFTTSTSGESNHMRVTKKEEDVETLSYYLNYFKNFAM